MPRLIADISIRDVTELEAQLDRAVKTAIESALANGHHGVLITRYDDRKFTVTLTPEVPFGITRELDLRES